MHDHHADICDQILTNVKRIRETKEKLASIRKSTERGTIIWYIAAIVLIAWICFLIVSLY